MHIKVFERNAALLTLQIKKKQPGGVTTPYVLTPVTDIEFYGKLAPNDPDANALFVYTMTGGEIVITDMGTDPSDKYSEITVQCAVNDLLTPRSLYFHLDLLEPGRTTVSNGIFEIVNV